MPGPAWVHPTVARQYVRQANGQLNDRNPGAVDDEAAPGEDVLIEGSWAAVPINPDGLLAGQTIVNESALYVADSFSPVGSGSRWAFFDGGAFVFSAINAAAGVYSVDWRVIDANGQGDDLTGTATVTVAG